MTLPLPLLGRDCTKATWVGALYNLSWVTVGNILGGAVMVGGLYWLSDARNNPVKAGPALAATHAEPNPPHLQP